MEQQDKAGRMLGLVEQWIQSGQSQKDFARRQEIKLATLAYWGKKAQAAPTSIKWLCQA